MRIINRFILDKKSLGSLINSNSKVYKFYLAIQFVVKYTGIYTFILNGYELLYLYTMTLKHYNFLVDLLQQ